MGEAVLVRGSCHHDCPDTCVWDVTVVDGTAVRLRGNRDHPTTRGELCPKVNRLLERVYHPDRVLTPLRRVGAKGEGRFEPISWDEAIAEVAGRLAEVRSRAGGEAILPYSFAGTQGVIQMGLVADGFFAALGSSDLHRDLCGVTAWQGAADVTGQPYGIDPEDLRHARTILLWGTNTYLTNRHLWPVITEARRNGAVVIAVDPVRTATAARCDHHVALRPGTDVALVLALVRILERDGRLDEAWLAERTTGADELLASAAELPLSQAAEITGIPLERIEWLAHRWADEGPSVVRTLIGAEHRQHGRELLAAVAMLPALTGAWRATGGGLARSTQVYFDTALNLAPFAPDPAGPPRRRFNMARLGEVLTDPALAPPIEALVVHNSNPAVSCPDQNRVLAGLARDDLYTVVIEQFVTDTARYADIVLPATTQLEHLDLGLAWGHLYLSLNQPAIEPVGLARSNSWIFRRLAEALALPAGPGFSWADDDETLIRRLLDSSHPWLTGITYDRLQKEAWCRLAVDHGHRPYVDAGPAATPATPDGRFQLRALRYQPGRESQAGDPARAARQPLTLFSPKAHPGFLNTAYAAFPRHQPAAGEPRLLLHPRDAEARGIATGDRVEVANDRGSLTVTAEVSDDLQPGLAALPFGWWHRATPEGRSVNALTNPSVGPDDTGSPAFHETLVEVRRLPTGEGPGEG